VVLFPERAPASTSRFLENVEARLYDGTIFHRVISSTLVQGGQYTPSLEKKKARAPIYCEARNGLSNMRGTVSMARLDREIDSARSQFFINLADNFHFDHRGMEPAAYGYAVFGRVFSGMDVVDRIGRATTEARTDLLRDVPTEPIEVIEMRRVR
jgi:cyclophilin family peptidyl-prolyl cis-trans isomerase